MKMQITQKGKLYTGECSRCTCTHFVHEFATWDNNEERDAMEAGTLRCLECGSTINPDTFTDCGMQYAGRYSMPGYLDCTSWHFSRNKRTLARELRDLYGED